MRKFLVIGALLVALTSSTCAKERSAVSGLAAPDQAASVDVSEEAQSVASETQAAAPVSPPPVEVAAQSRKLIRTVNLDLRVRATEPAAREVQALAVKLGGYVSEVNAYRVDDLLHYNLVLRIPTSRLDEALAAVKKLAERVDGEQQRVEDVTDRYIDLEARLRTLQATERELQALLAESRQRQRGVEDIMAVYRQLTEIRSQIEVFQGQRDALARQVALSTLNVRLTPTEAARPVVGDAWSPGGTAKNSVRILLRVLRGLGDLLIFAVIVLVPTVIVLYLLVRLLRPLWRRLKLFERKKPVPPPTPL